MTHVAPMRLLICGTSTFAEDIAEIARDVPGVELAGFVENLDRERTDRKLLGLPVHWIDDIGPLIPTHQAVCGLGTTRRDRLIRDVESHGMPFTALIHPSARIARSSQVGEGTVANAGVIVGTQASIGRHVLLNSGALVGHHTRIERFASLMPGANVAGHCQIGERAFVGMGAVVINGSRVGAGAIVGAGAVVTQDVPEHTQVVGVPARVVREDVEPL